MRAEKVFTRMPSLAPSSEPGRIAVASLGAYLSKRTMGRLLRLRLDTLGDVTAYGVHRLSGVEGFGEKCHAELLSCLRSHAIRF